jgi:hypothetical protein
MTNQVHRFRDRDIKRVVKAARAAGLNPDAIEVDTATGKIKVFSGRGGGNGGDTSSDLDQWLDKHRESSPEGH